MRMSEVITELRKSTPSLVEVFDGMGALVNEMVDLTTDARNASTESGRKVLTMEANSAMIRLALKYERAKSEVSRISELVNSYTRVFETGKIQEPEEDPRQMIFPELQEHDNLPEHGALAEGENNEERNEEDGSQEGGSQEDDADEDDQEAPDGGAFDDQRHVGDAE